MRPIPGWAKRAGTGIVLAALVAWSFWQRWKLLDASPFPVGIDGYYYPIQVRELIEHGTLRYPASPLTFWWMVPFALVTDPIVGAKLGAALGGALVAIPAYGVGARLGNGRGPGIVAAAFASCATSSQFLSVEFVKQGVGITVAMLALWLVLRAAETRTRRRLLAAGAGLLAALLTHKTAAAMVVLVGVPAIVAQARGTGALRGRRLLYVTGAAVVALIVLLVVGLVFPERFLSPRDVSLVESAVTAHARWEAPALVIGDHALVLGHDALFAGIVALVAALVLLVGGGWRPHNKKLGAWLVRWRRAESMPRTYADRTAAWICVGLGVVLALPWLAVTDPQGLGFRLRLSAFVPLALCAAVVARGVFAFVREWERDALCVLIAVLVAHHDPKIEGEVIAHPALVAAASALDEQIPAGATVVIAERHVAYMVAWYAHARIAFRPDDVPREHRVRLLLPLSPATGGEALREAVDAARAEPSLDPPLGVHPRDKNGMVLVTERTWDWMVAHMPPAARDRYTRWPTI